MLGSAMAEMTMARLALAKEAVGRAPATTSKSLRCSGSVAGPVGCLGSTQMAKDLPVKQFRVEAVVVEVEPVVGVKLCAASNFLSRTTFGAYSAKALDLDDFSTQAALTMGLPNSDAAITFFVRNSGASVTNTSNSRKDSVVRPPRRSIFFVNAFV
mmetsp:Transcript_7492/g.25199  ORF Transcript_7492/g.25199 Transcript_7492/m.25199 type:complete len:156 (-) Transcript_7492:878-1345(-)